MSAQQTSSPFNVFVGREREFAELCDALEEISEGSGRLFLVHGEPGIGKTALVEQVARLARQRVIRVLWGRCWEGDGAPAYWPWIQVIRALIASLDEEERRQLLETESAASMETLAQIVPELFARSTRPGQPLAGRASQSQFSLFDAVAHLLKDATRLAPVLIVLDDLHDADPASLTMLQFFARELRSIGVLLIGTYREAEMQRSPALSGQIGELAREARSLPLGGLNSDEVAELFDRIAGWTADAALTEQLYKASAGNPLFVDGVVRGLISQPDAGAAHDTFNIPHTLREAIGRRLGKLSELTRTVLRVAAAIGNEFEATICGRVKQLAQAQVNSSLDEATRDGIVVALGHGNYRFTHALIRASIYDGLDTNDRLQLHSAIGNVLEELHADNLAAHCNELAHHFREGNVRDKAIDYSCRAGQAAFEVFAYQIAAENWLAALKLTEGQRDLRRAKVLYSLGNTEAFFLEPSKGIAHLEQALALFRELHDQEHATKTVGTLGLAYSFLPEFAPEANVPQALEYLHQALNGQGESSAFSQGWLYQGLAAASFQQLRLDDAINNARRATQIWRDASNPLWITSEASAAQYLMLKGRHQESAALIEKCLGAIQGSIDPGQIQNVTFIAAWIQGFAGNPLEAQRLYAFGTERPGLSSYQREGSFEFLAATEAMLGNLVRAKELAGTHRMNPIFQGCLALYEGDWEKAIDRRRTMMEWAHRVGQVWDFVIGSADLAHTLYVRGDFIAAVQILDGAIKKYDPSDYALETLFRPLAVFLEIELHRPERAAEHLEVCRKIIGEGEDWKGTAGFIDHAEGLLAAAQRRPFATHFENATSTFKRYCFPFDEAETFRSWGIALLSEGKCVEAESKFDAAISIYRHHGAGQRWIDRVEAARDQPAYRSQPQPVTSRAGASFRKEGDIWTIEYGGRTLRLKDAKGLGYLAHLLAHPGERVHVHDLVLMMEGSAAGTGRIDSSAKSPSAVIEANLSVARELGDAGAALDSRARIEYRETLRELRVELEEAANFNDSGRAECIRREIEFIENQLSSSIAIAGRDRVSAAHIERARGMVSKRIRATMAKIRDKDRSLANHFEASIKTGYFCAYLPEADSKISWQL